MPVKLNQFATGTSIADGDQIVGYTSAAAGGERKWSFSTLKNAVISEISSRLVPVGTIGAFPATTPPAGWIQCNGAVLSRTQFPALWAYAQASGNLISEAQWYTATPASWRWGSFTIGDGINTFRIPELRGEFLRGWASNRDSNWHENGRILGSWQHDAIREIVGWAGSTIRWGANGAFAYEGAARPGIGGGGYGLGDIVFRASRVVPTAPENLVRNIAVNYCIKI